jgi:hypothetical protein
MYVQSTKMEESCLNSHLSKIKLEKLFENLFSLHLKCPCVCLWMHSWGMGVGMMGQISADLWLFFSLSITVNFYARIVLVCCSFSVICIVNVYVFCKQPLCIQVFNEKRPRYCSFLRHGFMCIFTWYTAFHKIEFSYMRCCFYSPHLFWYNPWVYFASMFSKNIST